MLVGLFVYAAMSIGSTWCGMGMGVHSLKFFAPLTMQVNLKRCAALFGDADNVGNVNDDIDMLSVCQSSATCVLLEVVGLGICLLVKQSSKKSNFLGTETNSQKFYSPLKEFDLFV